MSGCRPTLRQGECDESTPRGSAESTPGPERTAAGEDCACKCKCALAASDGNWFRCRIASDTVRGCRWENHALAMRRTTTSDAAACRVHGCDVGDSPRIPKSSTVASRVSSGADTSQPVDA